MITSSHGRQEVGPVDRMATDLVTRFVRGINLQNPNDPVTITNLPYDVNGNVLPNRSLPRNAGVGVANEYQRERRVQLQVRFSF
jgi:hypothetical protein